MGSKQFRWELFKRDLQKFRLEITAIQLPCKVNEGKILLLWHYCWTKCCKNLFISWRDVSVWTELETDRWTDKHCPPRSRATHVKQNIPWLTIAADEAIRAHDTTETRGEIQKKQIHTDCTAWHGTLRRVHEGDRRTLPWWCPPTRIALDHASFVTQPAKKPMFCLLEINFKKQRIFFFFRKDTKRWRKKMHL